MLTMGKYIATFISFLGGKIGVFGNMAEKSPRGTAWWGLLAGGAGVVGIKPEWLEVAANLLQRLAAAMQ